LSFETPIWHGPRFNRFNVATTFLRMLGGAPDITLSFCSKLRQVTQKCVSARRNRTRHIEWIFRPRLWTTSLRPRVPEIHKTGKEKSGHRRAAAAAPSALSRGNACLLTQTFSKLYQLDSTRVVWLDAPKPRSVVHGSSRVL
jgi:hypothetical protein